MRPFLSLIVCASGIAKIAVPFSILIGCLIGSWVRVLPRICFGKCAMEFSPITATIIGTLLQNSHLLIALVSLSVPPIPFLLFLLLFMIRGTSVCAPFACSGWLIAMDCGFLNLFFCFLPLITAFFGFFLGLGVWRCMCLACSFRASTSACRFSTSPAASSS